MAINFVSRFFSDVPRSMSFVLIVRCRNFPTFEILNDSFNIDDSPSTILCEISSNFYFFTIFLRELKTSETFFKLFFDYLKRIRYLREKPCRTALPPIFSSIKFYRNRIRFQVDSKVNLFDESINCRWFVDVTRNIFINEIFFWLKRASIQLRVLVKRIHYESSWAWLSTLGGGHSCLGEVLKKHVRLKPKTLLDERKWIRVSLGTRSRRNLEQSNSSFQWNWRSKCDNQILFISRIELFTTETFRWSSNDSQVEKFNETNENDFRTSLLF